MKCLLCCIYNLNNSGIDQRIPIFIGSKDDVDMVEKFLKEDVDFSKSHTTVKVH